MKGKTIAILVIVVCVTVRLLIDFVNQPEESDIVQIDDVQTTSFLAANASFFVKQNIVDTENDSVIYSAQSTITVSPIDTHTYKLISFTSDGNTFTSLFDNLNFVVVDKQSNFQIKNDSMLIRQMRANYDNFSFTNYGNTTNGEFEALDTLWQKEEFLADVAFFDLKLHAIDAFNNKKLTLNGQADSIKLNSLPHLALLRKTTLVNNQDSTSVTAASQTLLNNDLIYSDTLDYNLKFGTLKNLTSTRKINDKYSVRQVITLN